MYYRKLFTLHNKKGYSFGSNQNVEDNKTMFRFFYAKKKQELNCVKLLKFLMKIISVNYKLKIYKHVKDKKLKYQYQRFQKVKVTVDLVKRLYKYSKNKNRFFLFLHLMLAMFLN